jgi:RimJ/RimL family protein N-acetyltransferase
MPGRHGSTVVLREACAADADDILEWRNDPVTRAMSRRTEAIGQSDHLNWLTATLHMRGRLLLVAEIDATKIGMARFDELAPDTWEVSINLNPAHRGKGLSRIVLERALAAIKARRPERILAEIKPVNEVSRHVFEALGFRRTSADGIMDRFELVVRHSTGGRGR